MKSKVEQEVKLLDHVKLFNKLKNDLMIKLKLTEDEAAEQAEMITATFRRAEMA